MNRENENYFLTLGNIEYCAINDYEDLFFKNELSSQYYDEELEENKWYIKKYILKIDSYSGQSITTPYVSTTGGLDTGSTVYYVDLTPEDILLDDTLQTELETIYNYVKSYEGNTTILQYNDGLPFLMETTYLEEGSDSIEGTNNGNIYSKPTISLEGSGIVDIYLEDIQMFEVDLTTHNKIVIDTDEMEAYNPSTGALANRQVTGEYDVFKLDSGEFDLRFSGSLTKATVTNYQRWL